MISFMSCDLDRTEDVLRRVLYFIAMLLLILPLSGCIKNKTEEENAGVTVTPTPQPTVTIPVVTPVDEDTSGVDADTEVNKLTLIDYYPIQSDVEYIYEGSGNEYASYTVTMDFIDPINNIVQTRTNNGGTETVKIIEIKQGEICVNNRIDECYYRDNLIEKANVEDPEVLLMEPIEVGTEWTLPDKRKRYISAMEVTVDTPSGTYQALEVTTKGTDDTIRDYYAPKVGLVKSVFGSGDREISSMLKERNTNAQLTQIIEVFYPDVDEKIYVVPLTITFRTGDETRLVLQEALHEEAAKETYLPLINSKTTINSLYLGEDLIVHVDFTEDFVSDMNLGAGYEALVLQSITNTLGNYYGVDQVLITIDGKPYESGHILMNEGETFQVNMDSVVRK